MARFVSLAVAAGMAVSVTAQTVPIAFCASFNTGSGAGNFSTWQSDGLCSDFCSAEYAFSVVQNKYCWCSNTQPGGSGLTSTDDCNSPCPGWTDDWCAGDGLFAYMRHDTKPSSTADGGSGSSSTAPPSETTTATSTSSTSTDISTTTSTTSSFSSSSTTTFNTPSPSDPTDSAPAPSQSVSTITRDGKPIRTTVYIQPTGTSDNAADSTSKPIDSKDDGGLSTGAAVGIAIGVVAAVAIVGGILFFTWYRRRKNDEQQSIVERTNSARGSSRGMMGTPRTEMASIWDENGSQARRNSRYMPHDPRMDPFAGNIYGSAGNKSRESIGSLEDNQDYSRRVLRTTNPDPE